MAKIIIRKNLRVEVFPNLFLAEDWELKLEIVKDLLADIKRHLPFDTARIEWDTKTICEFCKRDWEVDDDGCPVCCQEADDEHNKKVR